MRNPESDNVLDITSLLPYAPSPDAQKPARITTKVSSLAERILQKTENGIADSILGDSSLIGEINYEDDLSDAKRAMDLYKRLRSALEYYKQQPEHLSPYKRTHRETGFFSLLALYVELTANAANKPCVQYLTPEQIQFLKQVHAKIPTLGEITRHMEYLHHAAQAKQAALQRKVATKLRAQVTGRTGPVPAEQNVPEQFASVLLDVLHELQEEEKKPLSQHANITGVIRKLAEVAQQYSIGLDVVQRAIEITCPEFEFRYPNHIAKLLIQGVMNELQS